MRISELARQAGVATSTVRYYERIGLLPTPARSSSGYRSYDDDSAGRLLFITRAKRIGLSLEQISALLPIWNGVNCAATHEQITQLVDAKRAEVLEQIEELRRFADQLVEIGAELAENPPSAACLPDLSCCVPETDGSPRSVRVGATIRRRSPSDKQPSG